MVRSLQTQGTLLQKHTQKKHSRIAASMLCSQDHALEICRPLLQSRLLDFRVTLFLQGSRTPISHGNKQTRKRKRGILIFKYFLKFCSKIVFKVLSLLREKRLQISKTLRFKIVYGLLHRYQLFLLCSNQFHGRLLIHWLD